MEMQFFVEPGQDDEWMQYWKQRRMEWVLGLGIRPEKLRFHQHQPDELAHYAKDAYDIQYEMPFGWQEFEGIHNRTDFDLKRHQEYSGKRLEYVDPVDRNKKYIPYIIETSAGADRTLLVVLMDAYREEQVEGGETRVVLALHPSLAPIKAAVFPLVNKDGMPELATRIHEALRRAGIPSQYDDSGSIGKRYRRQDEAGTPFCITVDGQSGSDQTVTVRERDSLQQVRISIGSIEAYLLERIRS
jgi:glycyl-tRNA synthetase